MGTICIYHGNCADGFGAAWVVRKALGSDVRFHPGVYGDLPPDVTGMDVIMVDFSYKRPVIEEMGRKARSMLVIDHHKTAAEDLAGFPPPIFSNDWTAHISDNGQDGVDPRLPRVVFDMNHSGAMLAWKYFFHDQKPPRLLCHIEDRDLWRFALSGTREIQAYVFSYPYDFAIWDAMISEAETDEGLKSMCRSGEAIERKHFKDIDELLSVMARPMEIGGVEVMVANLPYTMASDGAGKLAENAPFGATYYDAQNGRVFSLRSRGTDGADVSEIAKAYGGGGHRNAAGFRMPIGWDGDAGWRGRGCDGRG